MASDTDISKLQKLMNKAMRSILQVHKLTSIQLMLDTLCWLSVQQRIYYNSLVFVYKIENKQMPQYLQEKMIQRSTIHSFDTRFNSNYIVPLFKKSNSQNSIFHKGIILFNKLKNNYEYKNFQEFKKIAIKFVNLEFPLK